MIRIAVLVLFFGVAGPADGWAQNFDNPFQRYDRDQATILLYHFDQDNGAIEPNDGSPALFGNITGGHWVAEGRFGGALFMDGATRIDPAHSLRFTSDDLTMEAWIYQTERLGAVFLMDTTRNYEFGTYGRLLAIDVNGRPFALAMQGGTTPRLALAPDAIPLNTWVHVAGIWWDSFDLVQIAVNGRVEGTDFLADDEDGSNQITIGRSQSIPDPRGFVGRIDEIRVSSTRRLLQPVAATSRSWGAVKALF